ncbi:hypothetical protein Cflav_PD5348 [Pedosphaera parvula Ellin514]|uniref:Uncharacterized protein n=1 Tax=Pedosphaera parvula (strain Ellin514) TaxID=320771 RepID=B9XB28_PEDPL|nr:hypothetical protein Cflav_PD5348 [Pedosphaera parvula Ellin514]
MGLPHPSPPSLLLPGSPINMYAIGPEFICTKSALDNLALLPENSKQNLGTHFKVK